LQALKDNINIEDDRGSFVALCSLSKPDNHNAILPEYSTESGFIGGHGRNEAQSRIANLKVDD